MDHAQQRVKSAAGNICGAANGRNFAFVLAKPHALGQTSQWNQADIAQRRLQGRIVVVTEIICFYGQCRAMRAFSQFAHERFHALAHACAHTLHKGRLAGKLFHIAEVRQIGLCFRGDEQATSP